MAKFHTGNLYKELEKLAQGKAISLPAEHVAKYALKFVPKPADARRRVHAQAGADDSVAFLTRLHQLPDPRTPLRTAVRRRNDRLEENLA